MIVNSVRKSGKCDSVCFIRLRLVGIGLMLVCLVRKVMLLLLIMMLVVMRMV